MSVLATITSFVSGIFQPAADLIDNIHTSEEEKLTLRNELAGIESKVHVKMIELQTKTMEYSSKIAVAEASSDSWFTRMYRPIIITGMFVMLSLNAFGLLTVQLPDMFITIFGACFGVAAGSRGIEKITRMKNK